MKKIFNFIIITLTMLFLTSCKITLSNEVKVLTPYGTPYMAIGGLIGYDNVKIDAVNGADGIKTELVKGDYDVILAPINLASQLFNMGNSKYVIEAVITMNNAYIVTDKTNKLDSMSDLSEKAVIGFGQTGIPGSILKKLYDINNLDQALIDFSQASSTAVYSLYAGNTAQADYVLLSEPEISKLVINDDKEIKTLDLAKQLAYDVPQACLLVNPNSDKMDDIENLLSLIKNNVKELNAKPEKYADKIISLDRTFEALGKEVIIRSIPLSNIVYNNAKDMKNEIENILTILGVNKPGDEFYR